MNIFHYISKDYLLNNPQKRIFMKPLFNTALLAFFIINFSFTLSAQDIIFDWQKILSNGMDNRAYCIANDTSGNIYIDGGFHGTLDFCGTQLHASTTNHGFILKLNQTGQMIWVKQIKGSYIFPRTICFDKNNDLYVAGYFSSWFSIDDTIIHTNNTDTTYGDYMFIAKFDTDGNLKWAKGTQGNNYNWAGEGPFRLLAVDTDNNLLITGRCREEIQYFDTSITITTLDSMVNPMYPYEPYWQLYHKDTAFIAKYSPEGQKLWIKPTSGYPCAMRLDCSGNIVITGTFTQPAYFDTIYIEPTAWSTAYIVKYDSLVKVLWAERMGGESFNYGYDVLCDNLNNIYCTGLMSGNDIIFNETIYFSAFQEGFLVKYNSIGIVKWVIPIGTSHITHSQNNTNLGVSLAMDKMNKIFLLGSFKDNMIYGGEHLVSGTRNGTFLMKIDTSGNVLKAGQFVDTTWAFPYQIIVNKDSNIYYCGQMYINTWNNNIIISKIDNELPLSVQTEGFTNTAYKIFPNPVNKYFYISYTGSHNNESVISLIDIWGKVVYKAEISGKLFEVDTSNLSGGLYVLLISDNETIFQYKIIKLEHYE